jgi:UPF0716 family protein affecting phage T7 exclusion
MFSKSALVVAALVVAELAVFIAAAGRFNPLLVVAISIALSVIGIRFLLRQAPGLIAATVGEVAEGLHTRLADQFGSPATPGRSGPGPNDAGAGPAGPTEAVVADRAVKIAAAGLLAFPGLVTGVVGFLLLFVGPVRGVVASSLGSRLASLLPAGALDGRSFVRRSVQRDVVDVTFTVKDPAPSSAHREGARASIPELPAHGTK